MDDLKKNALHYLAQHQVMTLATLGQEGVWATAVFYVNVGFDLYFLSAGQTRHAQNFEKHAHISAAIQEDYADWQGIQGIQLEGKVALLVDDEKAVAVDRYQQKYPFMAQEHPEIEKAVARVNWYRLRPSKLYFIDNRKGLGHRDEVTLA